MLASSRPCATLVTSPHAITALVYGCEAIVAYDDHFKAISDFIPYKSPGDYV